MAGIDRKEAAEIVTLCNDCGVPHLAAGLIAEGVSLDEAKTRVSVVGAVQDITAGARRVAPQIDTAFAMTMLAEGKGVPAIRAAVFEAIVAEQSKTEISSHIPLEQPGGSGLAASRASMSRTLKAMGLSVGDRGGA
ncbi:hypothetical protein [Methylobacterium sp. D54C]